MTFILNLPKQPPQAFELKGRMIAVSVLRVLTPDLDTLCRQLDGKIATAPDLFENFPILLDFEDLPDDSQCAFDIARLNRLLRERSFIPVGIRGAGDVLTGIAAGVGIGVMSAGSTAERSRRDLVKDAPALRPSANLLIRHPVRSGQQIYAEGGDITVLATVSPGAEILADGNIHVYGSLRGRALAGVKGNTEARIFCQHLDAELISIAGNYRISEKIQDAEREHPVQVFLHGDSLVIEKL